MTHRRPYEVQVCLRPFTPQDVQTRQKEIIDRVEALADAGTVEPSVLWWSPKVCPPGRESPLSGGCPAIVKELVDLAESHGFSLEPFVRGQQGVTPGENDSLVLPVICLVIRSDGAIGGLYPVVFDGVKYTVEDGLRALEADEKVLNLHQLTQTLS